ncbi:hypothetical protein BY996DRAFT_6537235 [Phakopsora pachyrhizi]|nr:hypothetical protein BY996DRAFT_6537235 [Phakopsora pachyrhizi]
MLKSQNERQPASQIGSAIPDSTFAFQRPLLLSPSGKYICTNHHQLRLLNILTGEIISHVNSLQDIKITSMEFEASSPLPPTSQTLNNPGTTQKPIILPNTNWYVWCGTKDSQLFEFDSWERRVASSKSILHSSAVIGIYILPMLLGNHESEH